MLPSAPLPTTDYNPFVTNLLDDDFLPDGFDIGWYEVPESEYDDDYAEIDIEQDDEDDFV